MAEDATDHLTMLELPMQHKALLGQIRHWSNLKVASDNESYWVKDFTALQLGSPELKAIPFTHFYEVKGNLLFLRGSLLPSKKMPQFLWTPIERALPVEVPPVNHNLFELPQKINIRLAPLETEQQAAAMLVPVHEADSYMQSAPAIRLQDLEWLIVNGNLALIKGQPLLPLNGTTYWVKGQCMFPAGWGLEFPFLEQEIIQVLNPGQLHIIWWKDPEHYHLLPKNQFAQLSIASWRASTQTLTK